MVHSSFAAISEKLILVKDTKDAFDLPRRLPFCPIRFIPVEWVVAERFVEGVQTTTHQSHDIASRHRNSWLNSPIHNRRDIKAARELYG